MNEIKLIIADDHELFRNGLAELLRKHDEIKIVKSVADGVEFMEFVNSQFEADIVLLDITMPNMDGFQVLKELKASRQSIVISSPKLYHMERNKFVNILKELQRDGIEVAILTLTENGQSDYLRRQGLFVKIVPELSLCSCVMDKSSVWYGSINILGYPTEEDNIIRIKDIRLAEEFLDVIYNNGNGK